MIFALAYSELWHNGIDDKELYALICHKLVVCMGVLQQRLYINREGYTRLVSSVVEQLACI